MALFSLRKNYGAFWSLNSWVEWSKDFIPYLIYSSGFNLSTFGKNYYNVELLSAVENGDFLRTLEMIASGANVNYTDSDGNTPLFTAVNFNNNDIAIFLAGVSDLSTVNKNGDNPLSYSLKARNYAVAKAIKNFMPKEYSFNTHGYPLIKNHAIGNLSIQKVYGPISIKSIMEWIVDCFSYLIYSSGLNYSTYGKNYYNIELYNAVEKGDLIKAIEMIVSGADVNYKNDNGNTPIFEAINNKHDSVAILLASISDLSVVNKQGEAPLVFAIKTENQEIARAIKAFIPVISGENKQGYTPLMEVARYGKSDKIGDIVKYGINAAEKNSEGLTALHIAAKFGQTKTVDILINNYNLDPNIQDNQNNTPLMYAAAEGHIEVLRTLFKKADIGLQNNKGETALIIAAAQGHRHICKELIQYGANIEARDSSGNNALARAVEKGAISTIEIILEKAGHSSKQILESENNDGENLLMIASKGGQYQILNFLAEKMTQSLGCSVSNIINKKDASGKTAAYKAASKGHIKVLDELKSLGADLDLADYQGNSPLISAVNAGNKVTITKLIDCSVNLNVVNNEGMTALIVAGTKGNYSLYNQLLLAGANPGFIDIYNNDAEYYIKHNTLYGQLELFYDNINAEFSDNSKNANIFSNNTDNEVNLMGNIVNEVL